MSFSSTWMKRNPTLMSNSLARSRTDCEPELATEGPVPPGRVALRLLADPVEVVAGGQAHDRHCQQPCHGPSSRPPTHLEYQRQGRRRRPEPQDPVVGGQLGGAEALGGGEGRHAK